MVDVLRFIFQDFWHWLGSFLMLTVVSGALATGLGSVRGLISYRIERHD